MTDSPVPTRDPLGPLVSPELIALLDSLDWPCCVIELKMRPGEPVDGHFVLANRAFRTNSAVADVCGHWVRSVDPTHAEQWLDACRAVSSSGRSTIFKWQTPLLRKRWYDAFAFRLTPGDPRCVGFLFNDVTARKYAEDALYESEAKFRALAMQAQVSIAMLDLDCCLVYVNDHFCATYGQPRHELIGQRIDQITAGEDWREQDSNLRETLFTGRSFTMESCTANRDGDERWTQFTVSARREIGRGIVGLLAVGVDVSDRKRAEQDLQRAHDLLEQRVAERTRELAAEAAERRAGEESIRELIRRVLSTEEDERRRIARELHDNLGQQLTALHLKLEILRRSRLADEQWDAQFRETQAYLREFERDLDVFTSKLRPAGLYSLGLVNALTDFVQHWSITSGVSADLQVIGLDGARLAEDTEVQLYRIAQEALNNVAKHARATRASLVLQRRDGSIVLSIEDDGCGFELSPTSQTPEGMGLPGMRERAVLLGGEIQFESSAGGGTTVLVTVPAVFQQPSHR